ncbi:hypothetical protein BsWGS_26398 [Bradybaena similaris]
MPIAMETHCDLADDDYCVEVCTVTANGDCTAQHLGHTSHRLSCHTSSMPAKFASSITAVIDRKSPVSPVIAGEMTRKAPASPVIAWLSGQLVSDLPSQRSAQQYQPGRSKLLTCKQTSQEGIAFRKRIVIKRPIEEESKKRKNAPLKESEKVKMHRSKSVREMVSSDSKGSTRSQCKQAEIQRPRSCVDKLQWTFKHRGCVDKVQWTFKHRGCVDKVQWTFKHRGCVDKVQWRSPKHWVGADREKRLREKQKSAVNGDGATSLGDMVRTLHVEVQHRLERNENLASGGGQWQSGKHDSDCRSGECGSDVSNSTDIFQGHNLNGLIDVSALFTTSTPIKHTEQHSKLPDSRGQQSKLPDSSGQHSKLPDSSGQQSKLPESRGQYSKLPDSSGQHSKLPDSSGQHSKLPDSSGQQSKLPDSSGQQSKLPESRGQYSKFRHSRGLFVESGSNRMNIVEDGWTFDQISEKRVVKREDQLSWASWHARCGFLANILQKIIADKNHVTSNVVKQVSRGAGHTHNSNSSKYACETDVAPTCDSDVAPTCDSDVAPTCDSDVAPTCDSDVAPTCDSDFAPTCDSDVAPTCDSDVAPTCDSDVAPTCDSDVAPTCDSDVAPTAAAERPLESPSHGELSGKSVPISSLKSATSSTNQISSQHPVSKFLMMKYFSNRGRPGAAESLLVHLDDPKVVTLLHKLYSVDHKTRQIIMIQATFFKAWQSYTVSCREDRARKDTLTHTSATWCTHRLMTSHFSAWRTKSAHSCNMRRAVALCHFHGLRKSFQALKWSVRQSKHLSNTLQVKVHALRVKASFQKWKAEAEIQRKEHLRKAFINWRHFVSETQKIHHMTEIIHEHVKADVLRCWRKQLSKQVKKNTASKQARMALLRQTLAVWRAHYSQHKQRRDQHSLAVRHHQEVLLKSHFVQLVSSFRQSQRARAYTRQNKLSQMFWSWKKSIQVCGLERQAEVRLCREHWERQSQKRFFVNWRESLAYSIAQKTANRNQCRNMFLMWKQTWERKLSHWQTITTILTRIQLQQALLTWRENVAQIQRRRGRAVVVIETCYLRLIWRSWRLYLSMKAVLRRKAQLYQVARQHGILAGHFSRWQRSFSRSRQRRLVKQLWAETCARQVARQWRLVCYRGSLVRLCEATQPERDQRLVRAMFGLWMRSLQSCRRQMKQAVDLQRHLQTSRLQLVFLTWRLDTVRVLAIKPLIERAQLQLMRDVLLEWWQIVTQTKSDKQAISQSLKRSDTVLVRTTFHRWHLSTTSRQKVQQESRQRSERCALSAAVVWRRRAREARSARVRQVFLQQKMASSFQHWKSLLLHRLHQRHLLQTWTQIRGPATLGRCLRRWRTEAIGGRASRAYTCRLMYTIMVEWRAAALVCRERRLKRLAMKKKMEEISLRAILQNWRTATRFKQFAQHSSQALLQKRVLRHWQQHTRRMNHLRTLQETCVRQSELHTMSRVLSRFRQRRRHCLSLHKMADSVTGGKTVAKLRTLLDVWRRRLHAITSVRCYRHILAVRGVRRWKRFVGSRKQLRLEVEANEDRAVGFHRHRICKTVFAALKLEVMVSHVTEQRRHNLCLRYARLWKCLVEMRATALLVEQGATLRRVWRQWRHRVLQAQACCAVEERLQSQLLSQVFCAWRDLGRHRNAGVTLQASLDLEMQQSSPSTHVLSKFQSAK